MALPVEVDVDMDIQYLLEVKRSLNTLSSVGS